GMVAVDDTTIDYLRGRPYAPQGEDWDAAETYWRTLTSDAGAEFDRIVTIDAASIRPQVTWGTSPEMVLPVDGEVPDPSGAVDENTSQSWRNAIKYMDID